MEVRGIGDFSLLLVVSLNTQVHACRQLAQIPPGVHSSVEMKTSGIQPSQSRIRKTPAAKPGVSRAGGRKAGDATRERILDAAEGLFAENGYHGSSMREVADVARVQIALVTYHFGTKDVLFNKIVERRAAYMAHQRMLALDAARASADGAPLAIRDLVAGYVWPFVERSSSGTAGWRNYSLLIARTASSPKWTKVIGDHYDAVARQYLAEFKRALSTAEEEDVYHTFSFMVATMLAIIAEPGRVESLSLGRVKSADLRHVYERMLPFLVSAFEGYRR